MTRTQGWFLNGSLGSVVHLQVAFMLLKERSKERLRRRRVANVFHLHPAETNREMGFWSNALSSHNQIIWWRCINTLTVGKRCREQMPWGWWQRPLGPQTWPRWLMPLRLVLRECFEIARSRWVMLAGWQSVRRQRQSSCTKGKVKEWKRKWLVWHLTVFHSYLAHMCTGSRGSVHYQTW